MPEQDRLAAKRAAETAKRAAETARKRELFGPKKNGPGKTSPEARFWPKVDKRGGDECWLWQATKKNRGYGVFWDGERTVGAHVFAYRLAHGPVPAGHDVRHSCDSPSCVNPAHLLAGSRAENMSDKVERGRHHNQLKTHCPKGHPYDGVVNKRNGSTARYCKKCKSESYQRNKLSNLLSNLESGT